MKHGTIGDALRDARHPPPIGRSTTPQTATPSSLPSQLTAPTTWRALAFVYNTTRVNRTIVILSTAFLTLLILIP